VKRLAHVDVAQTRDDALIEEQRLDRGGATLERRLEMAGGKVAAERLRAHLEKRRIALHLFGPNQIEGAEAARIVERELATFVCLEEKMIMGADLAGSIRQRPDMPRWKINVSSRSVWISPYFARRPSAVTVAPVRRCRRSGGKAHRRSARRGSTRTRHRPPSTGTSPRTVVSTSGSSGMPGHRENKRAHDRIPLLEARPMDKVSFGYEDVAPDEKTRRVTGVFSNVAARYDLMNDLMSGGMHRLWKDQFVRRLRPRRGEAILDMAGGTGDVAFRIAAASDAQVTVADINASMLAVGQERAARRGIDGLVWAEENAEALTFADQTFDAYTIAFGIRNVTHIDQALIEAHRVLRIGGRFFCLEFSTPTWPGFKTLYDRYSHDLVPKIGKHVAGDEAATNISSNPSAASLPWTSSRR
jgi:demethylmenaquinone methyltransferase/2-methoxy-6-polyprenyl-1,4-benzoquinol methylase